MYAVAEPGIPTRDIATVIGKRLDVPVGVRPVEHVGWLDGFFALDVPTSSEQTRELLGWRPAQAGLLADLDHPRYFAT